MHSNWVLIIIIIQKICAHIIHPAGCSRCESRNTGASPFSFTIPGGGGGVSVLGYTTHGTSSFNESIMVKCLAQGHKRCDRPGRDSNPHSDNTRTWLLCTKPLGHVTPQVVVFILCGISKLNLQHIGNYFTFLNNYLIHPRQKIFLGRLIPS